MTYLSKLNKKILRTTALRSWEVYFKLDSYISQVPLAGGGSNFGGSAGFAGTAFFLASGALKKIIWILQHILDSKKKGVF